MPSILKEVLESIHLFSPEQKHNMLFCLAPPQFCKSYRSNSFLVNIQSLLFSIKIIKEKDHENAADDLTFNCYLLLNMIHNKRSMLFFPISWREYDQVSNAKLFKQAFKILYILRSYTFSRGLFLKKNHSGDNKYDTN